VEVCCVISRGTGTERGIEKQCLPFRERSHVSSAHRHQLRPPRPVMVVEGRPDGGMVLDQYPGFDLSISELCHALKLKLAQTRDSRYAYTTTRAPPSTTNSAHHFRHSFPLPLVRVSQWTRLCNYLTITPGKVPGG